MIAVANVRLPRVILRRAVSLRTSPITDVVLLVCGTLGLYTTAVRHNFLTDDYIVLAQQRFAHIGIGDSLVYFTRNWGINDLFYRPLVRVLWACEYTVFGETAAGWHAVGVVLYAANVAAVYTLTYHVIHQRRVAFVAALLFSLHPTHAEPALWISDQSDLLAVLSCLLALVAYIRFRDGRNVLYYAAVLSGFGVALLCKESAVVFVGAPVLYDLFFWHKPAKALLRLVQDGLWRLMLYVPFVVVTGAYFWLRLAIFGGLGGYTLDATRARFELWPFVQAYGGWFARPLVADSKLYQIAAVVAVLLLVGLMLWADKGDKTGARRFGCTRLFGFGLCWLVLFLLPALSTFLSLRFIYFSTVGEALALAALLSPTFSTVERPDARSRLWRALPYAQIALIVGLSLLAVQQTLAFQRAWRAAGDVVPRVVAQLQHDYPQPDNYALITLDGLFKPVDLDTDIPAYQVGLNEAVQIAYNNPTIQTVTAPDGFAITDQRLSHAYYAEFDGQQLVPRPDVLHSLQARKAHITGAVPYRFLSLDHQRGTQRIYDVGLPAPALGPLYFVATATCDAPTAQIAVRWLILLPDTTVERVGIPLSLQCDGRPHIYNVAPPDMRVFLYKDVIGAIQFDLPPLLTSVELHQPTLYRIPIE